VADLGALIEYIKAEEEDHRRASFEGEYRKGLGEARVEFDQRYL
jgi:hypothetical protein